MQYQNKYTPKGMIKLAGRDPYLFCEKLMQFTNNNISMIDLIDILEKSQEHYDLYDYLKSYLSFQDDQKHILLCLNELYKSVEDICSKYNIFLYKKSIDLQFIFIILAGQEILRVPVEGIYRNNTRMDNIHYHNPIITFEEKETV